MSSVIEASRSETPRRVTALAYHPERGVHEHIPPESISDVLAHQDTLLWLDITAPEPSDIQLLQEEFSLHPLALEEVITAHPRPKCAEYPGFYVLVLYAAEWKPPEAIRLRELVVYLGRQFIITAHREPFPEIEECVRRWRSNTALQDESIAAPLYSLVDTIADTYFPVVDLIAEKVDEVEDQLYEGREMTQKSEIFSLKRDLIALRRVAAGERDALNLLLRQDVPLFAEGHILYFQSVYDHFVRLVESIDSYRDLLSSAMDIYLSVVSNRLNQVMKTLTILSTMLMSASLIAGIYGMNFRHMPELKLYYGYYGVLGGMALIAALLALLFRRMKWF
jgi:magnesium transporter